MSESPTQPPQEPFAETNYTSVHELNPEELVAAAEKILRESPDNPDTPLPGRAFPDPEDAVLAATDVALKDSAKNLASEQQEKHLSPLLAHLRPDAREVVDDALKQPVQTAAPRTKPRTNFSGWSRADRGRPRTQDDQNDEA